MKFNDSEQNITLQEFEAFEKEYGFKLPKGYKNLMLASNGGRPVRRYFGETAANMFYSIKYGKFTFEKMYELMKDSIPDGCYPFAQDAFGNDFLLNLTPESYGKVYFVANDLGGGSLSEVAGSFEDFLNQLSDEME